VQELEGIEGLKRLGAKNGFVFFVREKDKIN
jgi:hypothetical protein